MHGFLIVLLPERVALPDKGTVLKEVAERVAPYERRQHNKEDHGLQAANSGTDRGTASQKGSGAELTRQDPNAKLDYWVLGGRFDGYIRSGTLHPDKSMANLLTELVRLTLAGGGADLPEDDHDDVETNVVPVARIHLKVLRDTWITPDLGWVDDIFALADDPRERYRGHWAAGVDYHF